MISVLLCPVVLASSLALIDTFEERSGRRWGYGPLVRVRTNFHAELRRSADSL